jgi:UDP-N-acetylmuramoyl-tripeptide--D-alanyl-D-alanine ligase
MAHVEFFGDLDGVARSKAELVAALPVTGVAVLNMDDPRVAEMAKGSPCPVLGYAVDAHAHAHALAHGHPHGPARADVRAERVALDAELRPRFHLRSPWGEGEIRLALRGVQQVPNALAAAATALWCGVPFDVVTTSLAEVSGSPLRMEVHRPDNGPVLVVDCYNANPASTEAALRSLAALPAPRKLALLGVMAELGAETEREHRGISMLAEELGIEVVGYQTDLYGAAQVAGVEDAVALLRGLGPGDAALVKGSRVARLEDVVAAYGVQSLVAGA